MKPRRSTLKKVRIITNIFKHTPNISRCCDFGYKSSQRTTNPYVYYAVEEGSLKCAPCIFHILQRARGGLKSKQIGR